MEKFKLGKNALILSIMTLLAVLTWIGSEVYWTIKKTTITEITKEQMAPLDPKIDKELILSLKTNLSLPEEELNTAIIITEAEAEAEEVTEE